MFYRITFYLPNYFKISCLLMSSCYSIDQSFSESIFDNIRSRTSHVKRFVKKVSCLWCNISWHWKDICNVRIISGSVGICCICLARISDEELIFNVDVMLSRIDSTYICSINAILESVYSCTPFRTTS